LDGQSPKLEIPKIKNIKKPKIKKPKGLNLYISILHVFEKKNNCRIRALYKKVSRKKHILSNVAKNDFDK
jgi:hypothetical protein